MDKDTALDLALEALEEAHYKVEHKQDAAKREQALTAIKQARSAPVQPIIGSYLEKDNSQFKFSAYESDGVHHNKPAVPAPVQEPVVWQYRDANYDGTWSAWVGCDKRLTESTWREVRPLYTTPPAAQRQWVGMTTEEMATCIDEPSWDLILRKAEQILKEKNA